MKYYVIKWMMESWGYCVKDCIHLFGATDLFTEDSVFNSEEEARQHIQTMLNSGLYREDITENNFEVVEVIKHNFNGVVYYTT